MQVSTARRASNPLATDPRNVRRRERYAEILAGAPVQVILHRTLYHSSQDGPGRRASGGLKKKSQRQAARRREIKKSKELMNESPQFEQHVLQLLSTKTGKRLLPELHRKVQIPVDYEKAVQNIAQLYGVSTTTRNSTYIRDVVVMLGAGCSYEFLEETIGCPRPRARRYRHQASKQGSFPALISSRYPTGPIV